MILFKKKTVNDTILAVFNAVSFEEALDVNGGDCKYGSCDMKGKGCYEAPCHAWIDSKGNMHGSSSSSSGC